MRCSKRYGCRGFTLVELIVVIFIIVLFSSALIPALGTAKRQARSVDCRDNMRQILAAVDIYSANNNGELPHNIAENNNGHARWWDFPNYLANHMPYPVGGSLGWQFGGILPDVDVWLCPLSPLSAETVVPYGSPEEKTYQQIYEDPDPDNYPWVWMTYTTLWRFGGFADLNMYNNDPAFKGPGLESVGFNAAPGENSDLAIVDYLAFSYGAGAGAKWESAHPFKRSSKGTLFHQGPLGDTGRGSDMAEEIGKLRFKFNSGYIDGHVESFKTKDIAIDKPQSLRGRRYFLPDNW